MNMPLVMDFENGHTDVEKICRLILPLKFFEQLDIDSSSTYSSDFNLYEDFRLLHLACGKKHEIQKRFIDSIGYQNLPLHITQSEKEELITSLDKKVEKMRTTINSRIEATVSSKRKSKFLVLVKKFDLSPKEREAFVYMLNAFLGSDELSITKMELSSLLIFCDMSHDEILQFLDDDRQYIANKYIEVEEGIRRHLLDMLFKLSEEMVMFLFKTSKWTESESQDLLGTIFYEVLVENGEIKDGRDDFISITENNYDEDTPQYLVERLEENEEDFDLHEFLSQEKGPICNDDEHYNTEDCLENLNNEIQPYREDQEYLNDQFQCLEARVNLKKEEEDIDIHQHRTEQQQLDRIRNKKLQLHKLETKVTRRLEVTRKRKRWMPRFEILAAKRGLDSFEKQLLLGLAGIAFVESIKEGISGRFSMSIEVGKLLDFFVDSFKDRLEKRRYFYRDARLVADGMINVSGDFTSDILDYEVTMDRKMLDYIAGLDTEICNIVDGGNIYFPKARLENVILPEAMKKEIVELVKNSYEVEKIIKKHDTKKNYANGTGTVLLFHGPPGTGKTMMANALANHLGKKILLINFPSLGEMHGDKVLKYFLREAKVNDAIVFFDECEAALESRDKGNKNVNVLLTEIERHDGVIIMATNRPYDIDSAMESRMAYRFEFKVPDMYLREKIWREHLPKSISLAEDIDLTELAMRYEFSGRFIKNAVIASINYSLSKDADNLVIDQASLEKGARMQLQGHLQRANLERSVVPRHGLRQLILPRTTHEALSDIIRFEKAKPILQNEWDFQSVSSYGYGNSVLFYGPPGTGKTMAAEAIGYEIGSPLMVVTAAELQSKYVGETAKNIDAIFKMAKNNNCILVFDDAEGIFGHRTEGSSTNDKYANMDSSLLLEHMERFPGMVILTTNIAHIMDCAFKDRLKHKIEFKMPDSKMRESIWKVLIPQKTPLTDDVNLAVLAKKYHFSGRTIKNCVFKAAAKAAVRKESERFIAMDDFISVAEAENSSKDYRKVGF